MLQATGTDFTVTRRRPSPPTVPVLQTLCYMETSWVPLTVREVRLGINRSCKNNNLYTMESQVTHSSLQPDWCNLTNSRSQQSRNLSTVQSRVWNHSSLATPLSCLVPNQNSTAAPHTQCHSIVDPNTLNIILNSNHPHASDSPYEETCQNFIYKMQNIHEAGGRLVLQNWHNVHIWYKRPFQNYSVNCLASV